MTEFSRPIAADRIGAAPVTRSVDAAPEELAALAARLMIPSVQRLSCSFRLHRDADAIIAAEGTLSAEVTQICVVSLDEFTQTVSERFELEFVPEGTESEEIDVEARDQIPYANGAIDLGEAASEQLALALDPYPKQPGAEAGAPLADEPTHPFAGLAALRLKP